MDMIGILEKRQVAVKALDREGPSLRKNWEERFAGSLGRDRKRRIHLDQHLWHLFSYEEAEHLSGREAEEAFDAVPKKTCLVFWQREDEALKLMDSMAVRAEDFKGEHDIYVMDDRMTWTYVHTHETDLGPYFHRIIL